MEVTEALVGHPVEVTAATPSLRIAPAWGSARASGDRVRGVILATGVNADGQGSGQLATPSTDAQADLLMGMSAATIDQSGTAAGMVAMRQSPPGNRT
mgnify:CR=1 FL=1